MKLNYKRRGISYGVLLSISIANAFIMPNIKKISVIDLALVIVPLIFLFFAYLSNKSDYNDYVLIETINNYSFKKDEIDKLHFEYPGEMADYFYKKFETVLTADFVLRLAVFAYNYFDIDELEKEESEKYLCTRVFFYESFDNADELRKLFDIPSTLDIESHVISYDKLRSFLWELFSFSHAKEDYCNVFNEKLIQEYSNN